MTASVSASEREEVLAADFDDFLRKPYRPREVFECMARHLGVEYAYGTGRQTPVGTSPDILAVDDLMTLPDDLGEKLEKAVASLDGTRIGQVMNEASGFVPRLEGRWHGPQKSLPILRFSAHSKFARKGP